MYSSVTGDIKKLEVGELVIYLVRSSLVLGIKLAKLGPTFRKCWLNCSAISDGLVNILSFLLILVGYMWPLDFLLINVPINFPVVYRLFLH